MDFRLATSSDLDAVLELQRRYHIATIAEEDKAHGFVTTLFTREQLENLLGQEEGLFVACDGPAIVGYAMAASWDYWSAWPFFRKMIDELPLLRFQGRPVTLQESFQYGPVCIDRAFRGGEVLRELFELVCVAMARRYSILVTFINRINLRSYEAHVRKLGLEVARTFELNQNEYYELTYDVSRALKRRSGANLG